MVLDADDGETVGIGCGSPRALPKALHVLGTQDPSRVLTALRRTSSRGTLPVKVALIRGEVTSSLKLLGYNGFQLSAAAKTSTHPTVFETHTPLIVDLCLVLSRLTRAIDRQRILHWASVQTNTRVLVHDFDVPADECGGDIGEVLAPVRFTKLVSRFEGALRLMQQEGGGRDRALAIAREFLSFIFGSNSSASGLLDSLGLERRDFRAADSWVAELSEYFPNVSCTRLEGEEEDLAAFPLFRAVAWNGSEDENGQNEVEVEAEG